MVMLSLPLFSQDSGKSVDPGSGWHELNIPMADGVLLDTEVYLPKTRKPCTTVLVRTPYDKANEKWMGKAFGLFDIAVVIQDVRGKFKSGGEFYPFINERDDGLQTLKWLRSQPWSNGIVAGWGAATWDTLNGPFLTHWILWYPCSQAVAFMISFIRTGSSPSSRP